MMMRAKPIQTTKWGTACSQCASAKAKCSGRLGTFGSKCDRCERLLKQCTDQVHKPRKTRQSRQSQPTDSGSPSFEFDSLVSTPEHPSSPVAGELTAESSSVGSQRSQDRPYLVRTTSSRSQQNAEGGFVAAPGTYNATPLYPTPSAAGRFRDMVLDGREDMDQMLLSKYRAELMPQHPFVIIPQHIPAAVLRAHHPFLMMSIRVIASFEGLHTMHARMQLVTGFIADRMFRQAERSLDLLMGIVIILGWQHYHCARHSQLNNLLCLAESLVSDLGLNKRPAVGADDEEEERSTEEKRLLLGVWYLRSSAAMHLQQLTSMPFTSYMRQCLVELQEAKTHDLDEVLIHFVKIQYLAERVAVLKSPQLKRTDPASDRMSLEGSEQEKESPEREAALAGCQAYLDRLIREMPGGLRDNGMMATQLNTVALRLSEPQGSEVLHSRAAGSSSSSRLPFASDSPTIGTLLQTAPVTIRGWFQSWTASMPVSRYRTLPSHAVLQLLYALRAAVRGQPAEQLYAQGQEGSASRAPSLPKVMATAPIGRPGPHTLEDATTVMDRLLALGAGGADVDKFWAALGEVHEDESTQRGAVAEHTSTPDDFSRLSGDGFQGMLARRSQGSQGAINDTFSTIPSQLESGQPMYPSTMFIPPSRVGSVAPGQHDYSDVSLLPPAPVSAIPQPGASHLPAAHPGHWTAAGTWNAGPSSWVAPGDASTMMVPDERMDHQMWEAGQGNPPYGWGDRNLRY